MRIDLPGAYICQVRLTRQRALTNAQMTRVFELG